MCKENWIFFFPVFLDLPKILIQTKYRFFCNELSAIKNLKAWFFFGTPWVVKPELSKKNHYNELYFLELQSMHQEASLNLKLTNNPIRWFSIFYIWIGGLVFENTDTTPKIWQKIKMLGFSRSGTKWKKKFRRYRACNRLFQNKNHPTAGAWEVGEGIPAI